MYIWKTLQKRSTSAYKNLNVDFRDQTKFAVRVISTYFTLYKAIIPNAYLKGLGKAC